MRALNRLNGFFLFGSPARGGAFLRTRFAGVLFKAFSAVELAARLVPALAAVFVALGLAWPRYPLLVLVS
jgi:hypothetical protein